MFPFLKRIADRMLVVTSRIPVQSVRWFFLISGYNLVSDSMIARYRSWRLKTTSGLT